MELHSKEHVTDTGNCQPKRKLCDPIFPRPIRGVNIAKRFDRDLGLHKQILVTCAVLLIDEVKRPVNAMCPGAAASDVANASASPGVLARGHGCHDGSARPCTPLDLRFSCKLQVSLH